MIKRLNELMEQLLNSFRRLNHDTLRWESIVSRYDSRPLLTNLMIRITNAATSSKWISPPETIFSEKPRIQDRKSTRLNSSHVSISYAVFCLKKKNKYKKEINMMSNQQ